MTSAKWYKKVVDLSADEKNIEKATLMMNFANNYETRTTVNKKGESTISIDEYWNTLETMADPDLMSKENIVVALKCYQFVANDLLTQNDWFRNNGLSESQYSEMLSNLKTYTQNITNTTTYKSNEISYSQLVDSIYNTINAAEDFGYGNKSNSNSNSESAGE
jgi:hypothetical protein